MSLAWFGYCGCLACFGLEFVVFVLCGFASVYGDLNYLVGLWLVAGVNGLVACLLSCLFWGAWALLLD